MNIDRAIDLVGKKYSKPVQITDNIFRAEAIHGSAPIGVHYFDFSQSVANEGFDLNQYLQKTMAADFYKHEGSLQWNYYLYFVLEKPALRTVQDSGKATQIESDRTFARKYIRDEEWLIEELSGSLTDSLATVSQPKDIASYWIGELNKAGLGNIADLSASYTSIVDNYLKRTDAEIRTVKESSKPKATIPAGKIIESLEIQKFRRHPSQKKFPFGQVNLIRGVNGSGKTSLLEAIELGICGGIRRQDGKPHPESALLLKFVGDEKAVKAPLASPATYRNIDAAWYGGYYRNVNKLCENFGRFNFFDADAGFRLSQGKSAEEIQQAVKALFLGEYANSLETIMIKCRDKFETKSREFSDRIASRKLEEAKIEADLATVRKIKNTSATLLDELQSHCSKNGLLKPIGKAKPSDLVNLQEMVEEICAHLNNSVKLLKWLPKISLNSINAEHSKLDLAVKDLKLKSDVKDQSDVLIADLTERIASSESKKVLLERLAVYHSEKEAVSLLGFQGKLDSSRLELDELKEAGALLKGLELNGFLKDNATIAQSIKEIDASILSQKKVVNQKLSQVEGLKKQVGELKGLAEQIKSLGRHFCELTPSAKDCPLCGAIHANGLLTRIDALKSTATLDKTLGSLISESTAAKTLLSAAQAQKEKLELISKASSLVLPEDQVATLPLQKIVLKLESIPERLNETRTKIDNFIATQKRMKSRGFTETELDELFEEGQELYDLKASQLSKEASLKTLLNSHLKNHDNLIKELKQTEKASKEATSAILAIVKGSLGSTDFDDPAVQIERRLSLLDDALSLIKLSKGKLTIPDIEEFSTIFSRLTLLGQAIERISESLKQVEEKDELEGKWASSLASLKESISQTKSKHERTAKALKVLNNLLASDNKESYLKGVIDNQREKLVSIFRQIHAPHEFSNVRLNGDIFLNRRIGGEATLSEISTGQRSALALSIFLSMNNSVGHSAPWLIFDDPIVHIDDLNILSFLDSLRDLVLGGGRQMFFATANSKVANLFARKFDFLGDSFKEIILERADSES